jgi:hypothetical protein
MSGVLSLADAAAGFSEGGAEGNARVALFGGFGGGSALAESAFERLHAPSKSRKR